MISRRMALLLAVAALTGCQGASTLITGAGWDGASSAAVSISSFTYSPTPLVFPAASGVTVTWTNNDPVAHDVTSDNGAFTSSTSIGPGGTYSLLFAAAGTYPYHCGIHPTMKGTVTVN
jgi:plastocyanin